MDILTTFYNDFINEAKNGTISSYFTYNILFETLIKEDNLKIANSSKREGVITPLLIINNKRLFNELLIEYVNLAIDFYKDSNYLKEIVTSAKNINIYKVIMATLLSNASYDDFDHPEEFLQRRINFIKNFNRENYETDIINILNSTLEISVLPDEIYQETPGRMIIRLKREEEFYELPQIKFGISNDTCYIYAIQNSASNNSEYAKRINRMLYKLNKGFDESINMPDIYGIENLKDISMSFLIAINILFGYLKSIGVNNVVVNSILPVRWNAKRIAIDKRYKDSEMHNEHVLEQNKIQSNLTEKLLRTFLRLNIHYDGIKVTSYPFDRDTCLHLDINSMSESNNEILTETFKSTNSNKSKTL